MSWMINAMMFTSASCESEANGNHANAGQAKVNPVLKVLIATTLIAAEAYHVH
jgi:hypothetical protein